MVSIINWLCGRGMHDWTRPRVYIQVKRFKTIEVQYKECKNPKCRVRRYIGDVK